MGTKVTVELQARDARFLRAASEVLKRYRICRCEGGVGDVTACFEVRGGTEDYLVTVHLGWALKPACTCPDVVWSGKRNGGYCKHIIAVLLKEKELQYQLLQILL